jgi:hypothetical protein
VDVGLAAGSGVSHKVYEKTSWKMRCRTPTKAAIFDHRSDVSKID